MKRFVLTLGVVALLNGCNCGPVATENDGGSHDGGAGLDAGQMNGDAGLTTDAGTTDAGTTDAGTTDAGTTDAGLDGGCSFGNASSLARADNLDLFGQVAYFLDGGSFAPGRYRISYVDGCMKYAGGQAWAVHAYQNSLGWYLVGETTDVRYLQTPGTADIVSYTNFADCVAANLAVAPIDFDFDGGMLGVWLLDSPYSDNLSGEGGRNPVWNLAGLDCQ